MVVTGTYDIVVTGMCGGDRYVWRVTGMCGGDRYVCVAVTGMMW